MKMETNNAAILLNFYRLSGPVFASEAGGVILALTNSTDFPDLDPKPSVASQQLTDYVDSAKLAQTRDRNAVEEKAARRRVLTGTLILWARYCMLVANGNRQLLTKTNFRLGRRGQEVPPISAPQKVAVTDGILPQSIKVTAEAVKESVSYLFQYTDKPVTPASVWVTESATSRTFTFTNLQQGVRYYFRVAAVGSRKQIAYSDVVSRIVQ